MIKRQVTIIKTQQNFFSKLAALLRTQEKVQKAPLKNLVHYKAKR